MDDATAGNGLLDQTSRDYRLYRALRKDGWKPDYAARFVRDDAILSRAEINGLISFSRVIDDDYVPDGDYDTEAEANRLNSGEYTAYGIIATLGAPEACCRTCKRPAGPAEDSEESLWGIVVDQSPEGDRYLRSVEIELAGILGVL